jgi:hypothetical protein
MNIIYLECKLLDITKRGCDFILNVDEACDALLGVKTAEAGMVAAGGCVLCFHLCSIQMTMVARSIQMKNSSHFSF